MKRLCFLLAIGVFVYATYALLASSDDKLIEEVFSENQTQGPPEGLRTVIQSGHRSPVRGIYFSKGDRMFISVSYDLVKLWDLNSGKLISTWDNRPDGVDIVGFNEDDNIIGIQREVHFILNCLDGSVIENAAAKATVNFRRTSANILKTIQNGDGFEMNVWTSRTGRYRVNSPKHPGGTWVRHTGFGLTLHDLETNTRKKLHEEERWIWDMAISGDGRYLASIEERKAGLREIRFYDLFQGALVHKMSGLPKEVEGLTDDVDNEKYEDCMVNFDGSRLMVCSGGGSVYVWRTSDWKLVYHFLSWPRMTVDYPVLNMKGDLVAIRHIDEGHCIRIINLKTGKIEREFSLSSYGDDHAIAFSPDGKLMACASNNRIKEIVLEHLEPPVDIPPARRIVIWDYETGEKISIIEDDQMYLKPFGFNGVSKHLLCGHSVYRIEDSALVKSIPDMDEKDLVDIMDDFGQFWVHHSQFAMNPHSPYYLMLDPNTGNMKVMDLKKHVKKCDVFNFESALIMVTPEGYFSGTGDYEDKVHFVQGKSIFPLERFFDVCHGSYLIMRRKNYE